jgi:hypothetical protein
VRIWRLLGAVLAVSAMLGGLLLVTAGPAAACTCAQMTEAQLAARVDVLFVGTLISSRVDPSVLTREYREERKRRERVNPSAFPESDPVVLTFEVSRVYIGSGWQTPRDRYPPGGRRGRRDLQFLCSGDSGAVASVCVSIVR